MSSQFIKAISLQIETPDKTLATPVLVKALKEASSSLRGMAALKTQYRPYICPLNWVLAQIPVGASLYDIGCGTGSLLYLAHTFRSVKIAHGYDISLSAIEAASVFRDQEGVIQVQYRLPTEPLQDLSSYDTISMIDVLHHIPINQQESFLYGLIECMAPGSRLILKDIDASQPIGTWCNQLHDLVLAREWVHPRHPNTVVRWLEKSGAKVSSPIKLWTLWYPHFILVASKP